MTEFFGGVRNVELTKKTVKLTPKMKNVTVEEKAPSSDPESDNQQKPLFAYQKQFPTDLINHLRAQQKMKRY